MPNNRLWLLIARKLSGEADAAELDELQALLRQHPDKQYLSEILQAYFLKSPDERDGYAADKLLDERFSRLLDTIDKDPLSATTVVAGSPGTAFKNTRFRSVLRYAAIIGGFALITWFTYQFIAVNRGNKTATMSGEVVAKPGARTKVVLPDGSQVWLNSGTRLRYSKDFNRHREVDLEGEAFFEVVKNEERPFIVHTTGIDVKVLGTSFTVKSYPLESTIETTLLEGSIEVVRHDDPNAPKVILKPNEKLIYKKEVSPVVSDSKAAEKTERLLPSDEPSISVTPLSGIPDSSKVETSWLYNRLVFNGDSFRELAIKMERWYNVKISFGDDRLPEYRFKGVFEKESVREALDALQLTANFKYKIRDNEINIFTDSSQYQLSR